MSNKIRKMDNQTFNELLEAGEIGLILADGGAALTKEQIQKVKAKAAEQSEDKLRNLKHAQATKPGYIESQIVPTITKLLKTAGEAMTGKKPSEQKTQQPDSEIEQQIASEIDKAQAPKKPTVSDKTKQTTKSLLGNVGSKIKKITSKLFGAKAPTAEPVVEEKKNSVEYLGSIYELMVQIEEDRRLELEQKKQYREIAETEEEKKHKEIVKALSIKRPAKPKSKPKKRKRGKKIKDTAKPAEPPKPTATPTTTTPSVRPAVSTAVKVAAGAVAAGGTTAAIAARESGGNYDITYGDRLDKNKNIVNSAGQTTPEKFLGKKLTEFTLEEVKAFQQKKNSEIKGTGAVGAYQFMPSTLFGQTVGGKFRPGLVQQLNLPMSTKFTKEIQDRLYAALHEADVRTLKQMGVPITPGFEYMAHYIGAGGAKLVYEESKRGSNKTVAQTLSDAGKSVGHNPELHKIMAKDFEKVLADRLSSTGHIPHSSAVTPPPVSSNTTGDFVNKKSTDNKDVRRELDKQKETQQTTVNVTNVTSSTNKNTEQKPVDDRPAPFRK